MKPNDQIRLAGIKHSRRVASALRNDRRAAQAGRASAIHGIEVLDRAQRRHKNNPKAQMAMFFAEFNLRAGTGSPRPVSERTRSAYADELMRMIDELRELRAGIQNIGDIGKTHVSKLIRHWGECKQAASTVQNKISILRRFLTFIGRDTVVPRGQELRTWLNQQGITAPVSRQSIPTESKAWDENGVDFHKVLAVLREHCAVTAIQLEVQVAFGLRMKESIFLNPQEADCQTFLLVVHGTKGGLPRKVPFDNHQEIREWQEDVLERAKQYAAKNRKGTLSMEGKHWNQSQAHFYYQCRKVGIKLDGLGVTVHGLRHQYAARRYAQLTGMAVPVSVNAPRQVTQEVRDADLAAREQISRELGHFRPSITQAYTGSLSKMDRARRQRIKDWVERTEDNEAFQEAIRQAGVACVWLGDRAADGLELSDKDRLRIIVQTPTCQPLESDTRLALKQRLAQIYTRAIDLSEHFDAGQPEGSLKINLRGL